MPQLVLAPLLLLANSKRHDLLAAKTPPRVQFGLAVQIKPSSSTTPGVGDERPSTRNLDIDIDIDQVLLDRVLKATLQVKITLTFLTIEKLEESSTEKQIMPSEKSMKLLDIANNRCFACPAISALAIKSSVVTLLLVLKRRVWVRCPGQRKMQETNGAFYYYFSYCCLGGGGGSTIPRRPLL
ncbi:unnamed protein product [Notodromas monacha]|uniref:Uncharacterized protein n=1 Tax=Notodromas monacha TaxID=399045 RepID=A0A7R9BKI8_9CRUS|nr:unnamed protein product [Notodromas monacha]CAG0917170.1 unnamed protein product [Notodromas monacha]